MSAKGLNSTARRRRIFSDSSGSSVKVLAVEVAQAVQNLDHIVPLIAQKRTIVRVYLNPEDLTRNVRVRAEISISNNEDGPEKYIVSKNVVSLRKNNHPNLHTQRTDDALSLYIELPTQQVGAIYVRVNRIMPVKLGDDVPISNPEYRVQVNFEEAPPLRIRAIGLRYTDNERASPRSYAPDALHFDFLKSYLTRAYPVPSLEWSQIVVPIGGDVKPPFTDETASLVLSRLRLIRQADVNAGRDPRTHYYGLIADDSGFFRGRATHIPEKPDPSTVAMGPAGRNRFTWDKDGSYADWYGAHELGHTLGCRHPGFCSNQSRDPLSTFPYENGRISDPTEDCVGIDVGDPNLDLPLRVLPYPNTSDFMTYCEKQWVSRHTYDEILDRLRMEDTLPVPVFA